MNHDEYPTDNPAVVTCGLPYANGDLHVGHLRTYVGGDVLARSLETLGQQTAFVCGSDMHGTPIAVNAQEAGISPETFALDYHEQYKGTFPKFNIEFDNYGHTHDETNTALTIEIVEALQDAGHIYEKQIKVAYDPEEDQYLPDRYVEGTCPYCGAKARGDECDDGCQRHLEPGEIEEPISTVTGNPAEYVDRSHKFFRVSEFKEYLSSFLDRLEGTSNAKNQPREWIEGDLQDWCITRDMEWGIDYPGEDEDEAELVLYVWVDAPIEYISSTKQYTERVGPETYDWADAWRDGDGEIVHVIGRDIIQHHTVFWPAMLRGAGYNEPRAVMASGFVNLDGRAFSTSRNRAIWVNDYLDEGFHPDLYRYYIITGSNFQQDVDFSWDRFAERVNSELVGQVGNFLYRSLLFAHRNYDGIPEVDPSETVIDRIEEALTTFRTSVNEYDLRKATNAGVELARFGNEYIQRNEPWNLVDDSPEEAAQIIRDCVQLTKAIAVLLAPTLPGKAQQLWEQLEEPGTVRDAPLTAAHEAPPGTFGAPEELFEGIEDERVEELNAALEARIEETTVTDSEKATMASDEETDMSEEIDVEPISTDRISFEDFQELDIRVAEIIDADPIEGADELLRIEIDLGVETRQIVAGLRQLHDVESLPGKRIIVVANLEKAELFGVESNGMLLAAGEQADLLTTEGDAAPGTKIE